MRKLAIATHDQRVARVEITVHEDVAHFLNNRKRRQLVELEAGYAQAYPHQDRHQTRT